MPISTVGMGRGSSSVVPQVSEARKHGRGMRPARGDRQSPQGVKDGQMDDGANTRMPLSVEADEFSLRTVPKIRVGSDCSEDCVPSREMQGGVVGQNDAVESTTAVTGRHPRSTLPGRLPRPILPEPIFRLLPG